MPVAFHIRHMKSDTRAQVYTMKEEAAFHGSGTSESLTRHPNYEGITASERSVPQAKEKSNKKIKTSNDDRAQERSANAEYHAL
ncbi:MAG: hypothetical protein KBS74_03790 [Clostridiales bacterium]|nr:hypothetical protein [Candidatus Cacconaster stercorequi]